MKRLIYTVVLLMLLLTLSSCGSSKPASEEPSGSGNAVLNSVEPTEPAEAETQTVLKSDYMSIEGIAVDDSYSDPDGKPLNLVFLFYKLSSPDVNLTIDSCGTKLTINGTNTYSSEFLPIAKEATKLMPNYVYTSYLTDVYVGETVSVAATFLIPRGDLTEGKIIQLADDQIPDSEKIRLNTDLIVHFASPKKIAYQFDEAGYEAESYLRDYSQSFFGAVVDGVYEEISPAECLTALCAISDGALASQWSCYVNNTTYSVSFYSIGEDDFDIMEWDDNGRFLVQTSLGTENGGFFKVKQGYIFCRYESNGAVIEIPYTFDQEEFERNPEKYIAPGSRFIVTGECSKLIHLDLVRTFDALS